MYETGDEGRRDKLVVYSERAFELDPEFINDAHFRRWSRVLLTTSKRWDPEFAIKRRKVDVSRSPL